MSIVPTSLHAGLPPERVRRLNDRGDQPGGRYVLYWMQQAQRAHWNHALEYAVAEANDRNLPVLVAFGLTDGYPEATERAYAFLLEGLAETGRAVEARGARFVLRRGGPDAVAADLAAEAAVAVTDRGYLRIQREWRERAARAVVVRFVEVESDVVVPVDTASDHLEFAARTLRPKIGRLMDRYLLPVESAPLRRPAGSLRPAGEDWRDPSALLASLRLDRRAARAPGLRGGAAEARRRLDEFVARRLPRYAEDRNAPADDAGSRLSAHLHFGQISPLEIAWTVHRSGAPAASRDAFLEELVVRRELSMNLVRFHPRYDAYQGLPAWALATLAEHAGDRRPHRYSPRQLEAGETHDPYWNAAQREMVCTGRMTNYMRMYWGKKILEWSASPAEAFATALELNNRYEIDGRDANAYAGVAWCFGRHDRPWTRRPIFGTVRYMNAAGLERKFDMRAYLARVAEATSAAAPAGPPQSASRGPPAPARRRAAPKTTSARAAGRSGR